MVTEPTLSSQESADNRPEIKIRASQVDPFEWLMLEAAWSNTKTTLPMQWDRLKQHTDLQDPAGVPGLIIGGNLQRALLNIRNAEALEADLTVSEVLKARAAVDIGKMAGGLVGLLRQVQIPVAQWSDPIGQHLTDYSRTVDHVLVEASKDGKTSLESNYYYNLLNPLQRAAAESKDNPDEAALQITLYGVDTATVTAARTWLKFLGENPDLMLDPGASPRSAGKYIDDLRAEFENLVPQVHQAAIART